MVDPDAPYITHSRPWNAVNHLYPPLATILMNVVQCPDHTHKPKKGDVNEFSRHDIVDNNYFV